MIRVLLADDQPMFRAGLRSLLENAEDVEVVGEAADGDQAVDAVARLDPDVVLMDIRMPHRDGLAATRELAARGARARILVLTTFDLDEYVFEALRAGAVGFLLKDASGEDLLAAVRAVSRGDGLLAPSAARRVIEAFVSGRAPDEGMRERLTALSTRETEVLRLVASGMSNAEIAAELHLSAATVKSHVHSLLSKLGARDRVQAVVFAYESGLVRAPDHHR